MNNYKIFIRKRDNIEAYQQIKLSPNRCISRKDSAKAARCSEGGKKGSGSKPNIRLSPQNLSALDDISFQLLLH